MAVATGDFITDAFNLLLERLDHMAEALDRIADAVETQPPQDQPPRTGG